MTDPTRAPQFAIPVYIAPAPGSASKNISTNATTEIYTSKGYASGISVNTAGTASTVKLYDGDPGASGILLGTWSTTQQTLISLSLPFATSLYAVTAGSAAADVTVSYVPAT